MVASADGSNPISTLINQTVSSLLGSDFVEVTTDGDTVSNGGNSSGSHYRRLAKGVDGQSESVWLSKETISYPFRINIGITRSLTLIGQEVCVELVEVDPYGSVKTDPIPSEIPISGTITVATNVATINTSAAHGLVGGQYVQLLNTLDPRLRTLPVVVTIITSTQFTIPLTLANATYTATGGTIKIWDGLGYASGGISLNRNTAASTTGLLTLKGVGESEKVVALTLLSTIATQANVSPYTDSFVCPNDLEIIGTPEDIIINTRVSDSLLATTPLRFSQAFPDNAARFKLRIRFSTLENMTRPSKKISAIAKTGTTTATVTCVGHGLAATDFVQIYGVRDITSFPNLVAMTAISSIVDADNFTIVIGAALTVSSTGGMVAINRASLLILNAFNNSVQSVIRTSNILTATFNAAVATPLPGQLLALYGMNGSASVYDGTYKVLRVSGSTVEFESIGSDFGSINTGGAVLQVAESRFHYFKVVDYTRTVVELANARGAQSDQGRALPVVFNSGTITTVSTVTAVTAVTAANLALPGIIADIASAALTTTTTTATLTPTFGCTYSVMMSVTAVTGTTPTLDVRVEESDDTGTNWFTVYEFPRITATGAYRSPQLTLIGNRVRYVQTVAGTTPSFTRSLNRLQSNSAISYPYRQIIDRTISLTTLNSVTPNLLVLHAYQLGLVVNVGAITTTAPQLQLEGSEDNGVTWFSIGAPLVAVASSTVFQNAAENSPQLIRARVSTAGVGVTAGYVMIKCS